ncbi:hypothetical protein B296_00006845 [Ensete ventricosum]|uniref:protein-serine/threonine phosphatase n=1 Tax=Ensete ventricosum TaxID=4639 RepID=A0A426Y9I4_ENSVE|nr:hypothetical protein B296_00006845 [Ensete ventricosum]
MRQMSSLFNGLAKSLYAGKRKVTGAEEGREAADELRDEAKKNDMILRSSGSIRSAGSKSLVSVFSQRGEKGVNQDCSIVWEVRRSLWIVLHGYPCLLDLVFLLVAVASDCLSSTSPFCLLISSQGELMVIANVGDSRAVLATTSDDGSLVPIQLTIDFKPNLPRKLSSRKIILFSVGGLMSTLLISEEAERITGSKGRVFCLQDEPGVHRVWLPDEDAPGLAMSRAFGDYCIKEYGLISVPEVTQRSITSRDQFVVLATDGVWDVISNQEAVDIVSSTKDRRKAAKRLVECAICAWKRKRRGIAVDDCSAICMFLHSTL